MLARFIFFFRENRNFALLCKRLGQPLSRPRIRPLGSYQSGFIFGSFPLLLWGGGSGVGPAAPLPPPRGGGAGADGLRGAVGRACPRRRPRRGPAHCGGGADPGRQAVCRTCIGGGPLPWRWRCGGRLLLQGQMQTFLAFCLRRTRLFPLPFSQARFTIYVPQPYRANPRFHFPFTKLHSGHSAKNAFWSFPLPKFAFFPAFVAVVTFGDFWPGERDNNWSVTRSHRGPQSHDQSQGSGVGHS